MLIVSSDLLEGPNFQVNATWDVELDPGLACPARPAALPAEGLQRFPFILFQKGSRIEEPIDRYFAANGFSPRVIMRFDNAEAIKAMIRTGLGISVLPVWIADADLRHRRLAVIHLTSAANYHRVLNMVPSPANGITFCQANFKAMGEDIEALARDWCSQKKIFFVHFRDIEGNRERFRETFHDNGPTDMAKMLQVYHECGFGGPMRPDHAPTMEGESNDNPGYAMLGKIFAIAYMKGIMKGLHIPYE